MPEEQRPRQTRSLRSPPRTRVAPIRVMSLLRNPEARRGSSRREGVMGRTPDRFAGPREEEEIQFDDRGPGGDSDGDPTVEGALRRVTNTLRFFAGAAVRQVLQIRNPPADFDDVDLSGLVNGQIISYDSATKDFKPKTADQVKVSSNDTLAGYLNGKITAGSNITLTENLDGGNENLEISAVVDQDEHRGLDQLVHGIAEDSYEEFTYSGSKVTNITVWTDSGKTVKIRETEITYEGSRVDTVVTKHYDAAGVIIVGETMTEIFSYDGGGQVADIERTLT